MNRGAEIALLALMLVLPLSALLARRVPFSQTLKMALAWLVVFGVGLLITGQLKPNEENVSETPLGSNTPRHASK